MDCKTFLLYKNLNDFCQKRYGQEKNLNKLGGSRIFKVLKKTDEYYLKRASQSLRCTCSKLCVGKYRTISLLHTAAVLSSYSRVPSAPKNLCVVLVGCRRRMFQQQEIVSIKLVTGKNIGPPSPKGLWFVWKGYFNQLCNLMESKVNSDISNNSAVYQTVMEELVCAVKRNG